MSSEVEIGLENVDPEDLEDLLKKTEESFSIKFEQNELAHVTTFGQLCDHIINKIKLEETDGCVSQQAFYKFQDILSAVLNLEKKNITPQTLLLEILPKTGRRKVVGELERRLGFKISILHPPNWIMFTFVIGLLISPFLFFWDWRFAVLGLTLSFAGLKIALEFGKELELKTVGQVVEKISWEHYLKSKRNQSTVNRKELEKLLTSWFKSDLVLDKLDRESVISR
jgi:hypothetical protein